MNERGQDNEKIIFKKMYFPLDFQNKMYIISIKIVILGFMFLFFMFFMEVLKCQQQQQ